MSAIETLSAAIHAACLRDLPDIGSGRYPELVAENKYLDSLTTEQKSVYHKEKSQLIDDGDDFFSEKGIPLVLATKRPAPRDCKITLFFQLWESKSLGYDEPPTTDENVFTPSYTVIAALNTIGCAAVYFGGNRLAYLVPYDKQDSEWLGCITNQHMPSQSEARKLGWLS